MILDGVRTTSLQGLHVDLRSDCKTDWELRYPQFNGQDGGPRAVQYFELHREFLANVVKKLHAHVSNVPRCGGITNLQKSSLSRRI